VLRPLREALAGWQPQAGARRSSEPLGAIAACWPELVGERVAEHSRPLELTRGVLVVTTGSSAWSQQLAFLSERILQGLRALPEGAGIRTLRFRVGTVRRRPAASRRRELSEPPSAAEGLSRLRRTVRSARRAESSACPACRAPRPDATLCAPCAGRAGEAIALAASRLMYEAPWLGFEGTAELVAGLAPADYERLRRTVLGRWWETLVRLRWAKRSATQRERRIASSYVLLESRLEPDRISRAIVRNSLGDDLECIVFGAESEPPGANTKPR
jgi:hypothetical protein